MLQLDYKKHTDISKDIEPLFISAFPSDERPPADIFFKSFDNPNNVLYGFYDNDRFIGFTSVIIYKNICYIFFLAIKDEYRNQGYGSKILSMIKEQYKDYVILLCYEEVDRKYPDYDNRKRREEFYIRNGFNKNLFKTNEFGVVFQTAYIGNHTVSFNDYIEIFKIGFGEWTVSHLSKA